MALDKLIFDSTRFATKLQKWWILMLIAFCITPAVSQPSGGPYGPVRQTYEIPQVEGRIFYVAPDGSADAQGQNLNQPTTIEAAISRAATGDVIVMRGGVYRTGGLVLNQGITIQPYEDERPVWKGSRVATEWKKLADGLWATKWDRLFPSAPANWWRREREGMTTPLHRFNDDMVFVDGRFLQSAGWEGEVDENSFYIDYESGQVYIGVDPTDKTVEITAHDVAIHRTIEEAHDKTSDGRGFTIRGITFTQYAYRAFEIDGKNPEGVSPESEHGKDVIGTTLEHCEITFCSRVGGYFRGDSLTIRHCKISDTSTEGIFILSSNDVLLEKNIFQRNNIEKITGYYPAAVKIFNQCYRVICRDNLVIEHPDSHGIWYDVGNIDGVFINNWIEDVGVINESRDELWPGHSGFFFEISNSAICAGNVFVDSDYGVLSLNSADVRFYQNTFINSTAAVARTGRSAVGDHFDWHPATGPDVEERDGHVFVNNLLVNEDRYDRPMLSVWQPSDLCERLNEPMMERLDHNVYVRGTGLNQRPLILWSPAANEECQAQLGSLEDLRKLHKQYSKNSRDLVNYDGPLFRSIELRNFELAPGFPAPRVGAPLPKEVADYLKAGDREPYVGAYPPAK